MAFIINLRDASNVPAGATGAIPNSTLQVTDLWPNVSQRNQIYAPVGLGPYYVNRCDLATVALAPNVVANATTADTAGLAAYLVANAADAPVSTANLAAADAATAATAIVDLFFTGTTRPGDTVVDAATINVAIPGTGVLDNTNLTDAEHVINILAIISGAIYTLPAGSPAAAANTYATVAQNEARFGGTRKPRIADTDSSLTNSILNGQLSFLGDDTLDLFGAAAAARVVQVYGDDGSLMM